jgi:hypothetical protein
MRGGWRLTADRAVATKASLDLTNECGLSVGVADALFQALQVSGLGQFDFERAVSIAFLRVRPEPITKHAQPARLGAAVFSYMHVMTVWPPGRLMEETDGSDRLSVTVLQKNGSASLRRGLVLHDDLDVDDRFCGQPRYRGGTVCSMRATSIPSARLRRCASTSKSLGHFGSYSTICCAIVHLGREKIANISLPASGVSMALHD